MDDVKFREALAAIDKDRPLVLLAYRSLRGYIRAAEAQSPLHSGHFAEAMSLLIGEITAAGIAPADWPAAFDLWRKYMETGAKEQAGRKKEARDAETH